MVKHTKNEIVKMRIKRIEKEIRDTPYHKATEHYIGRLRAKLSRLNEELLEKSKKGSSGGGGGYAVKKQGNATVTLVGPPSVGKSTLLNNLTNAKSKIAPYEFTTLTVIPGMMDYNDAKIQILDVPGLIEGAEIGKGRGREVLSVIRNSDLLILMCDVRKVEVFDSILNSLYKAGIRVNQDPPDVKIEKKLGGGIHIISNINQNIKRETIKHITKEYRITNADITIKEKLSFERLFDALSTNRVYIPVIFVVNKAENESISKKSKLKLKNKNIDTMLLSAKTGKNIDKLKKSMWKKLEFVKIFLVRKDEKPSDNNPLIMKNNDSLKNVAEKIGEEFLESKKEAVIWGPGSKYPGQKVSLSTKVSEGMQIRFN